MTPSRLLVEGWKIGFEKVAFTKLLQQEMGLSLSSAKDMTDQVLDGKQIALAVSESELNRVSDAMSSLGAMVRRDIAIAERSCR